MKYICTVFWNMFVPLKLQVWLLNQILNVYCISVCLFVCLFVWFFFFFKDMLPYITSGPYSKWHLIISHLRSLHRTCCCVNCSKLEVCAGSGIQWKNIFTGYYVNPCVGSEVWMWKYTQVCSHAHMHMDMNRNMDMTFSPQERKVNSVLERIWKFICLEWLRYMVC